MPVSRVAGPVAPTRKARSLSQFRSYYSKTNKRRIDVTAYYVPRVTRRDVAAAGARESSGKAKMAAGQQLTDTWWKAIC